MKKIMTVLGMGLFVTAITAMAAFAADTPTGRDVSMSGTFSCMSCALTNPSEPCAKGCCEKCIKAGDPAMLTDASGNRYILLAGEHMEPMMNKERYALLGGEVAVKGVLVENNGVQAIFVDDITARGKAVSMSGTFSCMSCSLTNPSEPCAKGCCEKCIKAGDPAMLTDASGNRYILLAGGDMEPLMDAGRYAMLGGKVTVKGEMVDKGGVQAIFVDAIEKN